MSLFTWRDRYSVQHFHIDRQHKELFRLADELHGAMTRGEGRQVLALTLNRLIEYTATHFRDEEQMMMRSGYPDYAKHKAEHDSLSRQVLELKRNLEAGKSTVTIEVLQFLKQWLEKHIQQSDQRIAEFLARKTAGTTQVA